MKKQSFLYGAAVLAVASILCKIMSAALKIPLDRLFLHEEGIGVYQSACNIYNVFLAVCVTGIPIALSSLVAKSDEVEAASLVKSTLSAVTLLGAVSGILMFVFATPLAVLLSGGGEAVAAPSLRILSLALPFMGVISSRKGYFQGKSIMTPSAMGQLAEGLAKVVLGIGICAVTFKMGISYGAAGAIGGVAAGAMMQALVLEFFFRREKKRAGIYSGKKAATVFKIAVPMTLGAFGFTAVMLLDTLTVPSLLAANGVDTIERLRQFGYLTRANTVYNLPATVISAFTASAVPALARAAAEKRGRRELGESAVRVIKLILLAAFPCAIGMMLFPKQLLSLIYSTESHWLLMVLAGIMVIVMPSVQTLTAMLQTLGKVWSPIWVTLGAIFLKAVLNIVFVRSFGVYGAFISTIAAFLPALIINLFMLARTAQLKGSVKITAKVFFCAFVSCGGARLIYSLREGAAMFLISIMIAAAAYLVLTAVTRCITKEEFLGREKD